MSTKAQLQAQVSQIEQSIASLRTLISRYELQTRDVRARINRSNQEIDELTRELFREEDKLSVLHYFLDSYERVRADFVYDLKRRQENFTRVESFAPVVRSAKTHVQIMTDNITGDNHARARRNLMSIEEATQTEIKKTGSKIQELQDRIRVLRGEIARGEDDVQRLRREIARVKYQISSEQRRRSNLQAQISAMA